MKESILNGKRILAVDDEPDVLTVLEEEILASCPNCQFDRAASYETGVKMLKSHAYDVVILDIMGVGGFDLLNLAASLNFKVAMLTAHALNPESLKRSLELKACAYLPKEKLGEIVPFLEDMLEYEYLSGWKRLFENLREFFNDHWGKTWQKPETKFWEEFDEKISHIKK